MKLKFVFPGYILTFYLVHALGIPIFTNNLEINIENGDLANETLKFHGLEHLYDSFHDYLRQNHPTNIIPFGKTYMILDRISSSWKAKMISTCARFSKNSCVGLFQILKTLIPLSISLEDGTNSITRYYSPSISALEFAVQLEREFHWRLSGRVYTQILPTQIGQEFLRLYPLSDDIFFKNINESSFVDTISNIDLEWYNHIRTNQDIRDYEDPHQPESLYRLYHGSKCKGNKPQFNETNETWDVNQALTKYLEYPWRFPLDTRIENASTACYTRKLFEIQSFESQSTLSMISPNGDLIQPIPQQCERAKFKAIHDINNLYQSFSPLSTTTRIDTPPSISSSDIYHFSSFAELGRHLLVYTPYLYHISHSQPIITTSVQDSYPFYFFSPNHCEIDRPRNPFEDLKLSIPWPTSMDDLDTINRYVTRESFPRTNRSIVPFFGYYCGWSIFPFSRDTHHKDNQYIVILNKRYQYKWWETHANYLSIDVLQSLLDILLPYYHVVYYRPIDMILQNDDNSNQGDFEDFNHLECYARSLSAKLSTPHQLYLLPKMIMDLKTMSSKKAPADEGVPLKSAISMNELVLSTLADAAGYVSVQGGAQILSSLFGPSKRAVMLHKLGFEAIYEVDYFDLISGTAVWTTFSEDELLRTTQEVFVDNKV